MSMLFPKQPASSGPFDLEGQLQSQASFGASQVPLPGAATAGHPGALDQVTFLSIFDSIHALLLSTYLVYMKY